MEKKETQRGFTFYESVDTKGKVFNVQKSSIATEDCIWLGCRDIELKQFSPGIGWVEIPHVDNPPDGFSYIANTHIHINQEMAAELIPILQRFVETGEI